MTENHASTPFGVLWERLGITEHMGGVYATRELIELCGIEPGQRVLDIACGTGYTACLLAKECRARVIAMDVNAGVLKWAKERVAREGVGDRVALLVADAQVLPFSAAVFDAVIAESVLVFCDQQKAASEIHRVLKGSGIFGANELTYLKPPPAELSDLFSTLVPGANVRILLENEWETVFREAGFADVSSVVRRISLWRQLASHLQVDGALKYLSTVLQAVADPAIRSLFFKKEMIEAALELPPYLGYGLYVSRK